MLRASFFVYASAVKNSGNRFREHRFRVPGALHPGCRVLSSSGYRYPSICGLSRESFIVLRNRVTTSTSGQNRNASAEDTDLDKKPRPKQRKPPNLATDTRLFRSRPELYSVPKRLVAFFSRFTVAASGWLHVRRCRLQDLQR